MGMSLGVGGTTINEILEAYPRLNHEAISAALAFATDTLRAKDTVNGQGSP
ncbi:MAG TPA: hypothetical protein DEV72_21840, partial [Ktedonobacter sp.]|nr:hypothetical protein [Ktedonobacter sp.]